jgi:hypothetical protein
MQQPIKKNKQQTAVEWFAEQIESGEIEIVYSDKIHSIKCIPEIIQQAKEIEKDKMENLWHAAISHGGCKCYDEIITFEEYYNETYNK